MTPTTPEKARAASVDWLVKLWPILVALVMISGTAYVALDRQSALAEELADQSESIDELEDLFNQLRETDIRTESQLKLEVQKLNSNIATQSAKIDQLLRLLQADADRRQ